MIEAVIRPVYQKFCVDPLAKRIVNYYTANQITVISGILGLLVIPALVLQLNILAIILLLLSGYCDTLDGSLARLSVKSSPIGTVLDIMTDRLVEFSVIIGLFLIDPSHRSIAVIFMLGSILMCITSFLVVGIFTPNNSHKSFHYSPGLIERPEAFLFFIVMIYFSQYFNLIAYIFSFLVLWTAYKRVHQFIRQSE